jgi:hypothetical protein
MKNIAVVHPTKWTPKSTVASAHLSKFVADQSGGLLIDTKEMCDDTSYDVLFFVNGRFLFCDFRDECVTLVNNAKRVIWIQNDYRGLIPSQLKHLRGKVEMWTTCPDNGTYINWNQLTYYSYLRELPQPKKKIDGLFYWGSFRKGREKSFDKYFKDTNYTIHISTSSNGSKGFLGMGEKNIKVYQPFESPASMLSFKTTIYLEDDKSHIQFHSLANRFYEALSAGLCILVDEQSISAFEKSGLKIDPFWIVHGKEDVEKKLAYSDKIKTDQQKEWDKDYKKDLINDFQKLLKEVL